MNKLEFSFNYSVICFQQFILYCKNSYINLIYPLDKTNSEQELAHLLTTLDGQTYLFLFEKLNFIYVLVMMILLSVRICRYYICLHLSLHQKKKSRKISSHATLKPSYKICICIWNFFPGLFLISHWIMLRLNWYVDLCGCDSLFSLYICLLTVVEV